MRKDRPKPIRKSKSKSSKLAATGAMVLAALACSGGDEDGDVLVYCACAWGIPNEGLNQKIPGEFAGVDIPGGGETTPNTGFAVLGGGTLCAKSPRSGDPVVDQGYYDGKCQGWCGSRLGWNRFAQVIGECIDGEPVGSRESGYALSPVQLPNSNSYEITGGDMELIRGGDVGHSIPTGSFELRNENCTAPCSVEMTYFEVKGSNTSIGGHDVTGVASYLRERIVGQKGLDGVVTFPSEAFAVDAMAHVLGDLRPQLLRGTGPVRLIPDGDNWRFEGQGTGPEGTLTFDLQLETDNHSPTAIVTGPTTEICDPLTGTGHVVFSALGSTDPDGDTLTFEWVDSTTKTEGDELALELPVGTYQANLYAKDAEKYDMAIAQVEVVDTAPPHLTAPTQTMLYSCGAEQSPVTFTPPTAEDLCSTPSLSGQIISRDGQAYGPVTLIGNQASVTPGTYVVRWTATKASGASAVLDVTYTLVGQPLFRGENVQFSDRVTVAPIAGTRAFTVADTYLASGVDSKVGSLFGGGQVFLANRAHVYGSVFTTGTVTQQSGVVIDGQVTVGPFTYFPTPGFSVTRTPSTQNVSLEPGQTQTLAPGSFGTVNVKANATLTLGAGDYAFGTIQIEPNATLALVGPVQMAVYGDLTFRGAIPTGIPLFEIHGQRYVFVETGIEGSFVAPDSNLILGPNNGGADFKGSYYAKSILVRPDVTVAHHPFSCP